MAEYAFRFFPAQLKISVGMAERCFRMGEPVQTGNRMLTVPVIQVQIVQQAGSGSASAVQAKLFRPDKTQTGNRQTVLQAAGPAVMPILCHLPDDRMPEQIADNLFMLRPISVFYECICRFWFCHVSIIPSSAVKISTAGKFSSFATISSHFSCIMKKLHKPRRIHRCINSCVFLNPSAFPLS